MNRNKLMLWATAIGGTIAYVIVNATIGKRIREESEKMNEEATKEAEKIGSECIMQMNEEIMGS